MDQFEKVEKIAQKANVSFEEAKAALEANNWDMLDAMIAIENANKGTAGSSKPQAQTFTTSYENQPGYRKVDTAEAKTYKKSKEDLGDKIKKLFIKSHENHFIVRRKGNPIINLPIWAAILIFCCFWKLSLFLFVVGLFFGCSYSFEGPANLAAANKTMNGIEKTAQDVKESFNTAYNNTKNDIDRRRAEEAGKAEEAKKAEEDRKLAEAKKAEEEARAAVEEARRMAAEFEQQDFDPITSKQVSESAAETFAADTARDAQAAAELQASINEFGSVFNDNSVTTADGSITLEL